MISLRNLADAANEDSFSNRMRAKRFALFTRLVEPLPRPLTILDIGGTARFWELRGWAGRDDVRIKTVNLAPEERQHTNIEPCRGDAADLSAFDDASVDVAFSNSVIEHLFTLEKQVAMAREAVRVGRAYWVQTPNYWFPMEPHFHVPGWQWMPQSLRVTLLRRRRCGWRGPLPDVEQARDAVREVRLMTRRELRNAFPDAHLVAERFYGFVKSWVVLGGFPQSRDTLQL